MSLSVDAPSGALAPATYPTGAEDSATGAAVAVASAGDDADAEELVHAGKAGTLVAGFRGAAPADSVALEDLVLRLSRLGEELPEVAELDLNPVLAGPDGCVAVDARVRLQTRPSERALKSW